MLLLAVFAWMITARIMRGMTLTPARARVRAGRPVHGRAIRQIIFRHLLPNMASLLIIDATITVGATILAETGLSYFGFGVQPPDVSLGTLIADGSPLALTIPWLFMFAGGLLVVTVLAVNVIGDGLRDALDPQSRGATPQAAKTKKATVDDAFDTTDVLADPDGRRSRPTGTPCSRSATSTVSFPSEDGRVSAVRGLSYRVSPGRGARHRRRVRVGQVGVVAGRDGAAAAVGADDRLDPAARPGTARPVRHGAVARSAAGRSRWCSRTRCRP